MSTEIDCDMCIKWRLHLEDGSDFPRPLISGQKVQPVEFMRLIRSRDTTFDRHAPWDTAPRSFFFYQGNSYSW